MLNRTPLVSVIMPAYNAEQTIKGSISTVLGQSYQRLELIVINDGSTDGTELIVKELIEKDQRIKLINQQNSGKPSIARNNGIDISEGDLICFLDADDHYYKDKIEMSVNVLQKNPTAGMMFHDVALVDASGKHEQKSYLENSNYLNNASNFLRQVSPATFISKDNFFNFCITNQCGVHTSAVLIRRELLESISPFFCEEMTVCEDTDLWLRVIAKSKVCFLNHILSAYINIPNSISKNKIMMLEGAIFIHKKFKKKEHSRIVFREHLKLRKRLADLYRYLAYEQQKDRGYKSALNSSAVSFLYYPSIKAAKITLKTLFLNLNEARGSGREV